VRKFYIIGGMSGNLRTLKINNASIDTLCAALLERMYFCKVNGVFVAPPVVPRNTVFMCLKQFRASLLKKIGKIGTKLTPIEFVSQLRGRKAAIYGAALPEIMTTGVKRRHAKSNPFGKAEKCKESSAPRVIQPRHVVYNLGLGCYLRPIEHRIYSAIGKVFNDKHVIGKGCDVRMLGGWIKDKWDAFARPVAIGLDAVKFDMHVGVSMLEWEHSIYNTLYKHDKELVRLLSYQLNNAGTGYCDDGKVKYSVEGRRFSGDMNTSLGNCIIMCAMVYTYARERDVNIKLINNGDDCVVFMEMEDETKFTTGLDDWFYNLGFRMTVETPVYLLAQVEFCQMKPISVGTSTVMVRNINTAREKESICLNPIPNESAMRKWFYAIGECGLALTSGVPILQAMYECYMRNGIKSRMQHSVQLTGGHGMFRMDLESKHTEVCDEARVSVFLAWGFTPDQQTELEDYYNQLTLHYSCDHDDNINLSLNAPL